MSQSILFIGGGNMAASLIGGLIANGRSAGEIAVVEPQSERRTTLQQQFGVQVTEQSPTALQSDTTVVLSVKPQVMSGVCRQLADHIEPAAPPFCLSIAAGVRTDTLARWLGHSRVVRAMPNTPALVGAGATGLYAPPTLSDDDRDSAEHILRAVGITCWVRQEADIDAVTALSGSGPAYAFYLIEAMQQAGIASGLDATMAGLLARQTVFGAAKLALESEDAASTLRQRVTSPGGTTERAIAALTDGGFEALVAAAIDAARLRAAELADEMDGAEEESS